MKKADLYKRLAQLESINDVLSTELENIHRLMKLIGFVNGITTLKLTAEDLISRGIIEIPEYYN